MALPLPPGLNPAEVGFLCEMEHVTVIPRQRLGPLELLSGSTDSLNPPFPATLPLWLALLLKRQRRANITPPPWLSVDSLTAILEFETDDRTAAILSPYPVLSAPATRPGEDGSEYLAPENLELSSPFQKDSSTSKAQPNALPYHWLELGHLLLTHAPDDFVDPDTVRRLLRDLQETRMSKLRKGFKVLDAGGGVKMNGVGAMEIAEIRSFVSAVVDGLRRINRSREESRKESEMDGGENGFGGNRYDNNNNDGDDGDDDDDDMQL